MLQSAESAADGRCPLSIQGVNSDTRGGEKQTASATIWRKLYPWKLMLLIGKECFTAHTSRDSVAFGIKVPLTL